MPRENLKALGNWGHPNKAKLSCACNWECTSQYARVVTVCDLVFAPEHHYTNHQHKCCVYSEMHTGDWWWSVQVHSCLSHVFWCLQVVIDIPQNTETRCHHHPTHHFIQKDTTYPFPCEGGLPSVPYNWQYSQGHLLKANMPTLKC